MSVEAVTKMVARGAQQNVRVLVEDLELLKSLKEDGDESLAVVFHRVITTYSTMYHSGNFYRLAKFDEVSNG